MDSPLTNNDVSPADKTSLQICANYANMATAATKWDMNELTGVNPWYQSGTGTVYPDRSAAVIEACQRYAASAFRDRFTGKAGSAPASRMYSSIASAISRRRAPGTARRRPSSRARRRYGPPPAAIEVAPGRRHRPCPLDPSGDGSRLGR